MFRKKFPRKTKDNLSLQLMILSCYFAMTVAKFIEFSSAKTGSNFLLELDNGGKLNDAKYFDPIVENIKTNPEQFIYPSKQPYGPSFYKEADLCREIHRGQTITSCYLMERNLYKTTALGNVGFRFYQERPLHRTLQADHEVISYIMDLINAVTTENQSELYSTAYVDAGLKFVMFALATLGMTIMLSGCLFGGFIPRNDDERRYRRD